MERPSLLAGGGAFFSLSSNFFMPEGYTPVCCFTPPTAVEHVGEQALYYCCTTLRHPSSRCPLSEEAFQWKRVKAFNTFPAPTRCSSAVDPNDVPTTGQQQVNDRSTTGRPPPRKTTSPVQHLSPIPSREPFSPAEHSPVITPCRHPRQ